MRRGFCAAVALARGILAGDKEKLADYRRFLTLGGSMAPIEELKVAGVDMSTPQPVCDALDYFAELVMEYKTLLDEEAISMDNMMQGYDVDAAVSQIGKAVSRAAHVSPQEAQAFVRRAIEADLRYMHETGVLDDDGLMGEEEYDDDDAFETLFARLTDGVEDDAEIGRIAQMLDSYMEAQQDFMEEGGLLGE